MTDEQGTVHRIIAVSRCRADGCDRCDQPRPHNIVVKCACGETATGKEAHIWTVVSQADGRITLTPSFDWEGHPVHEFVTDVPLVAHAELEAIR